MNAIGKFKMSSTCYSFCRHIHRMVVSRSRARPIKEYKQKNNIESQALYRLVKLKIVEREDAEKTLFVIENPVSRALVRHLKKLGVHNVVCTFKTEKSAHRFQNDMEKEADTMVAIYTYNPMNRLMLETEERILKNCQHVTGVKIFTCAGHDNMTKPISRFNFLYKQPEQGFYTLPNVHWYLMLDPFLYKEMIAYWSVSRKIFHATHDVKRLTYVKKENISPHLNFSYKKDPNFTWMNIVRVSPNLSLQLSRLDIEEFSIFLQQLRQDDVIGQKLELFVPGCESVIQNTIEMDKLVRYTTPRQLLQIFEDLQECPMFKGSMMEQVLKG